MEQNEVGHIIRVDKNGILVGAGKGSILLHTIAVAGKPIQQVKQIVNGNHIFLINKVFE
jgi:methionyl-tRNA formyltransferase